MTTLSRFSIVLPCFNEGPRIAASLATLEAWFGPRAEILVVDDGSTDDSAKEAERHTGNAGRVRVHRLPRHRGKGAAVRTAIPLVQSDRVVFMDVDLAFDRGSIERAVDALAGADMAIGNRRLPDSSYSVPVRLFGFLYRRHFTGRLFSTFVRLMTGVTHADTQCGLKAFRRSCLEAIAPGLSIDGFALDVEMLVVARALGMRVTEVPVHVRYETATSSVKLLGSGRAMVSDILGIALRRARGVYASAQVRTLCDAAAASPPDHREERVSRPSPGASR